jgi:hypothetical protein
MIDTQLVLPNNLEQPCFSYACTFQDVALLIGYRHFSSGHVLLIRMVILSKGIIIFSSGLNGRRSVLLADAAATRPFIERFPHAVALNMRAVPLPTYSPRRGRESQRPIASPQL